MPLNISSGLSAIMFTILLSLQVVWTGSHGAHALFTIFVFKSILKNKICFLFGMPKANTTHSTPNRSHTKQ